LKVITTERGWAGHFSLADQCLFRRNTLIEYGEKRVVVSTVGNCYPHHTKGELYYIRPGDVVYETLVFLAEHRGGYWEADCLEELDAYLLHESEYETGMGDLKANAMHEDMVRKFAQEMKG
jgi:hypothetical protein